MDPALPPASGAPGQDAGPDARPRSRAAQALPVIGVFIGVCILHMIAGAVVIAALHGLDPDQAPVLTAELLVTLGGITSSIFIVVALVAGAWSPGGIGKSLRLTRGRLGAGMVLVAVFAFLCLSQTAVATLDMTGWARGSLLEDMSRSLTEARGFTLAAAVVAIGIGGGLGEEMFFRGWMQTRLRPALGAWPAILATAAAFGVMHFDFAHTPVAFLFGILFGWLTEKAGSILPAIAAHIVNNIVAVLGAALLPASEAVTRNPGVTALLLLAGVACAILIARRAPGFAPMAGNPA